MLHNTIRAVVTRRIAYPAALIALLLVTAACGGSETAAPTAAPTAVSLQLSWIHEYSSAPFYAAERNGRFTGQNLSVTLGEGGFDDQGNYIDPFTQVLNGEYDFGLSNAANIILARSQGHPVVAVATVLQRSPLAVISLSESNLRRPQDLVGHTVAVSMDGTQNILSTLLVSQGVNPEEVNIVPRETFGIEPLIDGSVDAMVAWIINEGVQVQEAGHQANFIMMSDYGIEAYDFVVFTTEDMIANQPDVVQRFLTALTQGIQDVIANPEQAIDYTLTYSPDLAPDGQLRRLQATIPLINLPGSNPGVMSEAVWTIIHQTMLDLAIIAEPIELESAYSETFLNAIYSQ